MIIDLDVRSGQRIWATLSLREVQLKGRIAPWLTLHFVGSPAVDSQVILDDVTLRLEYGAEVLGEGRVHGSEIHYANSSVQFSLPTTSRLLRYVTDGLTSEMELVEIRATLRGRARGKLSDRADGTPGFVNDPAPGVWSDFALASSTPVTLQVDRAAWFSKIVGPSQEERYRFLEVALPHSDNELGREWPQALARLHSAERAYALGMDANVFQELRGALDGLPGAKQAILDGIRDESKRKALNELLQHAGSYLHLGRHVANAGASQGSFPVTHLDAAFALDLFRVLLSHLSLLLSSQSSATT